jgi:hypothetical protein
MRAGMQGVAHEPDDVDRALRHRRRLGALLDSTARTALAWRAAGPLAHVEPRAPARIQITLRHQPLVSFDDGKPRHALILRELADRRHAHAGPEHALLDTPPSPLHELFDERQWRSAVRGGNLIEGG